MTAVDVVYRYGAPPDEQVAISLNRVREVYGIRKISFDEKEGSVRLEYDATRLNETEVTNLLRSSGLDVKERVPLI